MKYKVERIAIDKLAINEGQIEGLPANPRQWTREDIQKIAVSLKETPELFELRPIIAVPFKDTNVILAGSLRFCGARENGDKDAPTILLPVDMPVEKMKEIVIKDNGAFGAWDFDALGNEWDDLPLADWGVPAWKADLPEETFEDRNKEIELGEDADEMELKLKFKFDEYQFVIEALAAVDGNKEQALLKLLNYGE